MTEDRERKRKKKKQSYTFSKRIRRELIKSSKSWQRQSWQYKQGVLLKNKLNWKTRVNHGVDYSSIFDEGA